MDLIIKLTSRDDSTFVNKEMWCYQSQDPKT